MRNKMLSYMNFFLCDSPPPPPGPGPPNTLEVKITHNDAPQPLELLWMSDQLVAETSRPLPDNTQRSQQTNIDASGGIRTHNLSRRAAADLRLRPRGHWDRRV